MLRVVLIGFLCGAVAVLVFHQGSVFLLHHQFWLLAKLGLPEVLRPAGAGYVMRPGGALGLPQVANTALWGGIWGVLLATLIRYARAPALLTGFLLGAVVCTFAGFTIFPWLRGAPMFAGWNWATWARVIFINGAWGWGAALLMAAAGMRRR